MEAIAGMKIWSRVGRKDGGATVEMRDGFLNRVDVSEFEPPARAREC